MRMEPRRLLRQSLPEILPSWCNVGGQAGGREQ